ncbi:serine hydrolase [Streptomyces sp. Rer75]|uniref:serine hydrolase domain-containing protein n=1 Tax=Streptomyces sp. Rer75 TaxID=2750011 RepID=UPI0015D06DE6|nr:serine hydrolase domain-containing protein [Streptomyces sp. Rer75]QLH24983.1 beta-lactamase family protein [Streptomyces sp. Rer75]
MNRRIRTARLRLAAATTAAAALLVGAAAVPAATADHRTASAAPTALTSKELHQRVARVLRDAGYTGITVEVRDGRREVRARAGVAERNTGRPMPYGANYRAASVTKTFVATVVLQLVAEGELSLSDPVEKWLPGVVSGNGNDGSRITIRNLLQHTSGIYRYDPTEETGDTAEAFEQNRYRHIDPEEIVAGAMRHRPDFPPAAEDEPNPQWSYSNPGYLLAGMIIKKVTGRSWDKEVHDRIVRPLGLTGTYAPGDDPYLRGPHAHTYKRFPDSAKWTDTTVRNVNWAGSAGSLVSTDHDVNRFYTALLRGKLLLPPQLAEMRRTVAVNADYEKVFPGMRYGLGLAQQPLTCGGDRWGHGGDLAGGTVRATTDTHGRRSVVVMTTGTTSDDEQLLAAEKEVQALLDDVMCARKL